MKRTRYMTPTAASALALAAAMSMASLLGCRDAANPVDAIGAAETAEAAEPADVELTADPGYATSAARIKVPEDHPGNPFYAYIFNGLDPDGPHFLFPHDEEWGAVIFEREVRCVPDNFNLLLEFDFQNAFSCDLTVDGFQLWHNPPNPNPVDPGPILALSSGLGAVPVVFAHWSEIQAAMADMVLTTPELLGLPSAIVGTAHHFKAQYVNGPEPHDRLMNKLVAQGTLPDGRSFRIHANESQSGTDYQIDIR